MSMYDVLRSNDFLHSLEFNLPVGPWHKRLLVHPTVYQLIGDTNAIGASIRDFESWIIGTYNEGAGGKGHHPYDDSIAAMLVIATHVAIFTADEKKELLGDYAKILLTAISHSRRMAKHCYDLVVAEQP